MNHHAVVLMTSRWPLKALLASSAPGDGKVVGKVCKVSTQKEDQQKNDHGDRHLVTLALL